MRSLLVALVLSLSPALLSASTDLILFMPPTESRIPAGGMIGLQMQLFNTGPDIARNTVITFDFPNTLTLKDLHATIGQCDSAARPARCVLGDLAANETRDFRFFITLGTPDATTSASVTVNVTSDSAETHPESNTITRNFDIIEAVSLSLHGGFVTGRTDPGTAIQARHTISNFLDSQPRDIHLHYEVTNGTIERIDPPSGWTCTVAGSTADCTRPTLDQGCRCGGGDLVITVRTPTDRSGGVTTLNATATSSLPEFYPGDFHKLVATAETYRWFVVSNTNDHGPGSLRAAITDANDQCAGAPCKIAFEISEQAGSDGAFTIVPTTPLPPVTTSRIFVDGKTQTTFGGDTNPDGPEIALDGRFTRNARAIDIGSQCEAIVEGLAVGNFDEHALFIFENGPCANPGNDARRVAFNYIGTNARGDEARPNLRGLYAGGTRLEVRDNVISGNVRSGAWVDAQNFGAHDNRIGVAADGTTPLPNGASGIYLTPGVQIAEVMGNRISYNEQMGVAVARRARLVDIRQNSMRHNGGLGIDIGLDGPNPPEEDTPVNGGANAPVVFAAHYDVVTNTTTVTGSLHTAPLADFASTAQVDVYANDAPDGDGEQWIGSAYAVATNGESFSIKLNGDYRNRWLNATSTRVHFLFAVPPDREALSKSQNPTSIAGGETKTSELSNAVRVD